MFWNLITEILIIYGGRSDILNKCFYDLFILDLQKMEWVNVILKGATSLWSLPRAFFASDIYGYNSIEFEIEFSVFFSLYSVIIISFNNIYFSIFE